MADSNERTIKEEKILIFVQITDLHISKFNKKGGYTHLLYFLENGHKLITPELLVITGDLTDGKNKNNLSSKQHEEEWEAYKRIIARYGLNSRKEGKYVIDQRGNHDCFNVNGWESDANYYRTHSVSKKKGHGMVLNKEYGKYCFVATDGCPRRGLARPLNFFGYLEGEEMDMLREQLAECKDSNHTIMLNHYPVSVMKYGSSIIRAGEEAEKFGIKELEEGISVFLTGHLHQLIGGMGKSLKGYKQTPKNKGYLELELGDMKDHAIYRVVAIDNDIISFVDVVHTLPQGRIPAISPNPDNPLSIDQVEKVKQPPVVLVTNPKDSRYNIPGHEPLERIMESTEIRILVWADTGVRNVHVELDGVSLGYAQPKTKIASTLDNIEKRYENHKDGSLGNYVPLYTLKWDPEHIYGKYQEKIHTLRVKVLDNDGAETTSETVFRLSKTKSDPLPINNFWSGGWIIMSNFEKFLERTALMSYFGAVILVLLIPKLIAVYHTQSLIGERVWTSSKPDYVPEDNNIATLVRLKLKLGLLVAQNNRNWLTEKLTNLVLVMNNPVLFYSLYVYSILICVFPLFTGNMIKLFDGDHKAYTAVKGHVYGYGVLIQGEWVPLTDTWMYAISSILYPLIILPLYLALFAVKWDENDNDNGTMIVVGHEVMEGDESEEGLERDDSGNDDEVQRIEEKKRAKLLKTLTSLAMTFMYLYFLIIPMIMTCSVYGMFLTLVSGIGRFYNVLFCGWVLAKYSYGVERKIYTKLRGDIKPTEHEPDSFVSCSRDSSASLMSNKSK
ncbi:Transmembrane protein 62 [Zancudomyces culisetae]|uniref:Transmembrane protein 62 n=1 Tax=Zancudomyces culisetae TaxID=1213189 RepID=A0A1R1PZ11_ZANCU|nr:Transmembrane protein 62 [Zancudomyces culisetae]|eukprot:OMH86183.1 Transmembrane protein 62 [Zancudomyces culisetae]